MNAPLPAHLLPRIDVREVPADMIDALKAAFGDRCSTAMAVREQHGRDESPIDAPPPAAVVFCESTEDVAAVVKLADRYAVPVIPVRRRGRRWKAICWPCRAASASICRGWTRCCR